MIRDIENGQVRLIITKDLSRLGRDYIQTGQYTEIFFPAKGVRFIAVNDGYDSAGAYSDIAPFKNVINEMYARDISRKIRSSLAARMEDGDYIGSFAPFGYQKDPTDKHKLIPDKKAAETVKSIFEMAADGITPSSIANHLNANGIPSPAVYRCMLHPHLNPDSYSVRKEWSASNILKLLGNTVYLGHLSQGKTSKVSFKSAVTVRKPKQDWIVAKNTHEPLISQELFDAAKKRRQIRTRTELTGFKNIFSGIARCADCGRSMSAVGTRKKGSDANLACGAYKLYGTKGCSNHFIDYNILYDIVLDSVIEHTRLSKDERDEILLCLYEKPGDAKRTHELAKLRAKELELDKIIERLYEDYVRGVLSGERFIKLLNRYELESKAITAQISKLDASPCSGGPEALLESFIETKELSADLLFRLIDRIEIVQGYYEKTDYGRLKRQTVRIYYKFSTGSEAKEYWF